MATVVVIDDEEEIRRLMRFILQKQGHTVLLFEDAQPALDTVNFDEIDLVIMDLQMPTPGQEAIRIIRNRGSQVPIVAMSGHIDEDSESELSALGAQGVLPKPFRVSMLFDVMRTCV